LEFCDSKNTIVIKHKETHLTLLNIRDIKTGEYFSSKGTSRWYQKHAPFISTMISLFSALT
jgi:hypothetical protein